MVINKDSQIQEDLTTAGGSGRLGGVLGFVERLGNKVAAVRALGAEVELVPAARRDIRPLELAAEGYVHVPPYDDPRIIAGQGTVGLELLEQVPDVETVLVPVSGGGLISGVATAVKVLRPDVRVVGVEPALAADAAESLWRGDVSPGSRSAPTERWLMVSALPPSGFIRGSTSVATSTKS